MEDRKIEQFEEPLKILKENVPLDKFRSDGLEELKRAVPLSANTEKKSMDIKNKPNKNHVKNYKGNKKQRVKAWILAVAFALGGGVGVAKEAIQSYGEYMFTAGLVDELSTSEIMDEIELILKEEVSKATGADIEEIEFYTDSNGTTSTSTIVKAGDHEYVDIEELRGGFNNDTLKATKLTKLIKRAKGGTRRELINTLKDTREFCEEYELVEEEGVLKQEKDKNLEKDENTSVQKNNQKIIEDNER